MGDILYANRLLGLMQDKTVPINEILNRSEFFNDHRRSGATGVADAGTTFLSRLQSVHKMSYEPNSRHSDTHTQTQFVIKQEAKVLWQRLHQMHHTQLSRVTDRQTSGWTD